MEYEEECLTHYGVKGMKWGVRRKRPTSGKSTTAGKSKISVGDKLKSAYQNRKKKNAAKSKVKETSKKKTLSEMSDDELNAMVKRMNLEKQYKDLLRQNQPQKSRGRQTVENILYGASENVGKQIAVYAMGSVANKAIEQAFGIKDAINPKKGQKD